MQHHGMGRRGEVSWALKHTQTQAQAKTQTHTEIHTCSTCDPPLCLCLFQPPPFLSLALFSVPCPHAREQNQQPSSHYRPSTPFFNWRKPLSITTWRNCTTLLVVNKGPNYPYIPNTCCSVARNLCLLRTHARAHARRARAHASRDSKCANPDPCSSFFVRQAITTSHQSLLTLKATTALKTRQKWSWQLALRCTRQSPAV